jgi:hypothetical protein
MRWKGLLSVFVILGIIGLLLTTESGQQYVDLLREKLTGFFPSLSIFGEKGEPFFVILRADADNFVGQSFNVKDGSFSSFGLCQGLIWVNDVKIDKGNARCNIDADVVSGSFEFTDAGTIIGKFDSTRLTIDDASFLPSDGLKVQFEIVAFNFLVSGAEKGSIRFDSITGELEKLKSDGSTDQIKNLDAEPLELDGFAGNIRLDGSSITMNGLATGARGSGFSFTG